MISNRLHEKYSNYHYCIVRECKNTSIKTPGKLWIKLPREINIRNTWLKLAKRDPVTLSTESQIYFCEDHFDLENDMENYMQYKLMGSVKKIRMKPDCVPTRAVDKSVNDHCDEDSDTEKSFKKKLHEQLFTEDLHIKREPLFTEDLRIKHEPESDVEITKRNDNHENDTQTDIDEHYLNLKIKEEISSTTSNSEEEEKETKFVIGEMFSAEETIVEERQHQKLKTEPDTEASAEEDETDCKSNQKRTQSSEQIMFENLIFFRADVRNSETNHIHLDTDSFNSEIDKNNYKTSTSSNINTMPSAIQMEVVPDIYPHQQQTQQRQRNIQSTRTRPLTNAECQKRYRERRKAMKMNACTTFRQSSDVQINKRQPQSSAERQRKYRESLREKRQQRQQLEDINAITLQSNTPHTSGIDQLQNDEQAKLARKRLLNKQRQSRFRARQRFESPSTSSHQTQAESVQFISEMDANTNKRKVRKPLCSQVKEILCNLNSYFKELNDKDMSSVTTSAQLVATSTRIPLSTVKRVLLEGKRCLEDGSKLKSPKRTRCRKKARVSEVEEL